MLAGAYPNAAIVTMPGNPVILDTGKLGISLATKDLNKGAAF